ncbi:MAG: hypothetical protein ACFHU9_13160 [Fluviicola sp.]
MKEIFRMAITVLTIGISQAYSQSESEWTRYDLEGFVASIPAHLELTGQASFYVFQSKEDAVFESLRIERYYFHPDSKINFLKLKTDTSTNFAQIVLDSATVHVHTKHLENADERPASWAYFSAGNYEYKLGYTGPQPERFVQFINSIEINYEKLKEQFERNKVEPDYSNLKLEFDVDLGGKDYVVNRTKNACKIEMPKSDSLHLFLSCSGCMLRNIKDDEWEIIPTPKADEIKISLQTGLPENRTHTFFEKTITVQKEE